MVYSPTRGYITEVLRLTMRMDMRWQICGFPRQMMVQLRGVSSLSGVVQRKSSRSWAVSSWRCGSK